MKPITILWLLSALLLSTGAFSATCGDIFVVDQNETDTALVLKNGNRILGNLKYRINERREAAIYSMYTQIEYRKGGVQKDLFNEMFERIGYVESFEAVLVDTNFYTTGLRPSDEPLFLECALAVMKTPIYKLLAAHGFRHVVRCAVDVDMPVINFKVTR
jgi:hypothetical protein